MSNGGFARFQVIHARRSIGLFGLNPVLEQIQRGVRYLVKALPTSPEMLQAQDFDHETARLLQRLS